MYSRCKIISINFLFFSFFQQRSNTVCGTVNSKRYSREFEDVSPFLFSSGSANVRRSKTRSPSLEELLEEVEKETKGPDYRYVPPPTSDSDNDTGSVSCHPLNRMSSGSISPNNNAYNFFRPPSLTPAASTAQQSKHCPSPLLKSPQQSKDPLYDFLSPQGFLKPRSESEEGSKVTLRNLHEKKDDDYVCLRPSSELHRRVMPNKGDKNTYSVPLLSDEVLSHTYEYLPPLPQPQEKSSIKRELEGFESYVEMAPRSDLKTKSSPKKIPGSPLKFSPVKKGKKENYSIACKLYELFILFSLFEFIVAMISDDPDDTIQTKYEPVITDTAKAPRSILTQVNKIIICNNKNSGNILRPFLE